MHSTLIEQSWLNRLDKEFEKPYMQELSDFLKQREEAGAVIFPSEEERFNAFQLTPFDQVKVVILGQDPYHGPNQAHGLAFSVKPDIPTPPSLKNIYKELQSDLLISPPQHGYLEQWAKQGVLLLNSVLTVEQGQAAAHQGKGWEIFTDQVINLINEEKSGVVFLLWGSYAHKKGKHIDRSKHLVLETTHPSPLSAHRGFLGCHHFSKANQFLIDQNQSTIDWKLNELPGQATQSLF